MGLSLNFSKDERDPVSSRSLFAGMLHSLGHSGMAEYQLEPICRVAYTVPTVNGNREASFQTPSLSDVQSTLKPAIAEIMKETLTSAEDSISTRFSDAISTLSMNLPEQAMPFDSYYDLDAAVRWMDGDYERYDKYSQVTVAHAS